MSRANKITPLNNWQEHYQTIEFVRNPNPMPDLGKKYPIAAEDCEYAGLWSNNRRYIPEGVDAFLDDYRSEYDYAYKHGMDYFNFQEWVVLERFFGTRLAYEEYKSIAAYYNEHDEVDGNIFDIESCFKPVRVGSTAYFTCSDSDSDIKDMPVKVVRLLSPAEADIFDVGPMYKVELPDGTIEDAYFDELKAS